MTEARVYHCGSCGGEVDEQARACRFCAAPVATVRCGHCFHMNVVAALHCSGCGRELGLEPIGEDASLDCPICHAELACFRGGRGVLRDCAACGGQFVEHALLGELLEESERFQAVLPRKTSPPPVAPEPVRYVRCPACDVLMNRKNFGGSSGVIIDVCFLHGVWFDAGDLPRVLAFVESGGLARARLREQRERESQVLRPAAGIDLDASLRSEFPGIVLDETLLEDLADAARDLYALVRDAARRR